MYKYNDLVKITAGFYQGQKGYIKELHPVKYFHQSCSTQYKIKLLDSEEREVLVSEGSLEKTNHE